MKESYKVYIGGIECAIASYDYMLFREPGTVEFDLSPLSPHQYLSILFNNMGYNSCPPDMLWVERNVDIENVVKSEVLDYPITHRRLMISETTNLLSLLSIIRRWIRGGLERGHILDVDKSFLLPSMKEIKFNMENSIKIVRSAVVSSHTTIWDRNDYFTRRLYNLVPTLDPDYFEFSIKNIQDALMRIELGKKASCAIFVSCMVDPDILFSAIEQSEKEVVHAIWNQSDKKTPLAMMDEKESIRRLIPVLTQKLNYLSEIYYALGARGFLIDGKSRNRINYNYSLPNEDDEVILHNPILFNEDGEILSDSGRMVLRELYQGIADTPLTDENMDYIYLYVEEYSLQFLNIKGSLSQERIAAMKRLLYTLKQLKAHIPGLMNPRDKFIYSEPFYVDPDRFALYKKGKNKFYVASLDLIIREMTPQEILQYYKVYLGKEVLHNPNEIGEGMASQPVQDVDILKLYCSKMEVSMNPEVDYMMMGRDYYNKMQEYNQMITQQPPITERTGNEEESYGLDASRLVVGL